MAGVIAATFQRQIYSLGHPVNWYKGLRGNMENQRGNEYSRGIVGPEDKSGVFFTGPTAFTAIFGVTRDAVSVNWSNAVLPIGTIVMRFMPGDCFPGIQDLFQKTEGFELQDTVIQRTPYGTSALDVLPVSFASSVVALVAIIQQSTTYVQGTDYELSDNSVDWLSGGNRPADNSQYSVRFTYTPTYQFLGMMPQGTYSDSQGNLLPVSAAMRAYKANQPNASS